MTSMTGTGTTGTLVMLRHGESEWNKLNLFTGWYDCELTEAGMEEAFAAGAMMADAGIHPDVLHTSLLRRAIRTAELALHACDRHWIPVTRNWRLNERHYGALQGLDKKATTDKYGKEKAVRFEGYCNGCWKWGHRFADCGTTPRRSPWRRWRLSQKMPEQ